MAAKLPDGVSSGFVCGGSFGLEIRKGALELQLNKLLDSNNIGCSF